MARNMAAAAGISLSALIRDCLRVLAQAETAEDRFNRLRRLQNEVLESIRARGAGVRSGRRLTREELYDRDALRREHEEHLKRDALR